MKHGIAKLQTENWNQLFFSIFQETVPTHFMELNCGHIKVLPKCGIKSLKF